MSRFSQLSCADLVQERQRSGDTAASSAQHAELLERIHTAKLLRESNSALRDENESNMRKAAALDARLRQALAELDPLKEQVQTLQAVVENKEHHLKLVEEDNERWKNRNQQILAKYERIDPEELQVLKDEVDKVKLLLGEAVSEKAAVAESLAEQTKLVRPPLVVCPEADPAPGRVDAQQLDQRSGPLQEHPDAGTRDAHRECRACQGAARGQGEARDGGCSRGGDERRSDGCTFLLRLDTTN